MNKLIKQLSGIFILILLLSGCEKKPVYPEKQVNPGLQRALTELGYSFNGNNLLINDKVINTTSLNFSGKNLSGFEGLELFPALKELIFDNNNLDKLGEKELGGLVKGNTSLTTLSFRNCNINRLDITPLARIENLYLDGRNNFTEIKGLSAATHGMLKSLHLPSSVKWNYKEVLDFYNKIQDKKIIKIETDGKLVDYTSFRSVPDETFRNFLKNKFPEVFTKDGKIDLNKKPDITDENKKEKTVWKTGIIDPNFFDASGIKNMEGLQFFKNRAITAWHIYNAEFESIDMSNDDMIESFRIGSNRKNEFDLEVTVNPNIRKLYISNCKNLTDLTFEGNISEINLDGNIALENLSFGQSLKKLDLSSCNNIKRIFAMKPITSDGSKPAELTGIVFPVSASWKGARMLDLSNTLISDIDFSKLKADDFFGVSIILEKCPNMKKLKIALKLGVFTSFKTGYFEEIDLRGSTIWNVAEQKWVPGENIKSLYSDNPNLKNLNGKPYSPEEAYPAHVKTFEANVSSFLQWTYFYFDDKGELKIRDVDTYPSINPNTTGKDAEWKKRNDWDFAIHYYDIRTNGGESGNANGGLFDTKQALFEKLTLKEAAAFAYEKDMKGNMNMILSLESMPPPRASVSMSKLPIFKKIGMPPTFNPTETIFALRKANGKYVLLKFTDFYDKSKNAGHITIKYTNLESF